MNNYQNGTVVPEAEQQFNGEESLIPRTKATTFTLQPGDRVTVQISRPLGNPITDEAENLAIEGISRISGGSIIVQPPIFTPPVPPATGNIQITSFSSTSGVPNSRLSIYGIGLNAVTSVTVGGEFGGYFAQFDPTGMRNDNRIDVLVPSVPGNQPVTGKVCVFSPNTLSICSTASFTIIPQVAAGLNITGFNPPSGAPNTIVNIFGSGFNGASLVGFGNLNPSPFLVLSDTVIQARVTSAAQTGQIMIIRGVQIARSNQIFTRL